MSNEAKYYFDLLQVIACLLTNEDSSFYKIHKFYFGASHIETHTKNILGITQAASFYQEVFSSGQLFSDELIAHLSINPIIEKLSIDLRPFMGRVLPNMSLSAIAEGKKITSKDNYFMFETSYFIMALTAISMDRICEFQSAVLEDSKQYISIANAFMESTGGKPQFVNEGSTRFYTTTLSAYFSRARELGGVKRFLDQSITRRSESFSSELSTHEWQIKSNDLVAEIDSIDNKNTLQHILGIEISETLLNDGIYYLKEKDFLNYNLKGFALDGGLINSFSFDGSEKELFKIEETLDQNDFIIDSRYQAIFSLNALKVSAYYGIRGRQLAGALDKYSKHSTIRAHRAVIPKVVVNSVEQFNEIVDNVRITYPDKDVYFRGQTNHHSLKRSALTNELLYGSPFIEELSLPTAASRNNFDFDGFAAILQMHLQGMIYTDFEKTKFNSLRENWLNWTPISPFLDSDLEKKHKKFIELFYSYEWDMLAMAVAQHYGIPTHGLDITNNPVIAQWFALNRWYSYVEDGKEYCWYKKREKTVSHNIDEYPVIYIIVTNKDFKRDLDQVDYINLQAMRPIRQNAFLHYGGWGLHNNICAQDVVVAAFLSPDFEPIETVSTSFLFPSIDEDPVYRELLKLKEKAVNLRLESGYQYIAEYKPEGQS